MKSYDLIVIGSGPAGEKAAVKAAYFGHSVAIIEKQRKLGGAGVNTGTLPSKTLKETALYYSGKYDRGLYGIERVLKEEPSIEHFMYRESLVCTTVEREVIKNLMNHKVDIYHGTATFQTNHEIRIKGSKEETIRGEYILIATGSYPFHPTTIPFDFVRVHDSDSILSISRFPKSLCILGAGVIGCEYATIFGTMGIDVFLVNDKQHILTFLDHEISQELVQQMRESYIDILFETSVTNIKMPPHEYELIDITLATGQILHVDMLLYAAGRSGCTDDLNCAAIGVEIGNRQVVVVNEKFQTSVENIYAAGDVVGFPALASTSMDQGRVAVSHMFKTKDLDSLPKVFPYGIYTIPEVSTVGMSEEEAKAAAIDYCTGIAKYKNMPRGKIKGMNNGFLKIVFRRDNLAIIGAHIIGALATELIHFGMTLVNERKTVMQVIATVFNYPTLHDLYKYASYDGLGNLSGHKIKKD
ncbi:MAG: Si-specific NAD(P)(+) transhydrogenase [Deltaproteobacteria bacterium]|nr:Si-specific NAD(P)(+) transhydrogenase [Deltaproteobacteria bacterium]